MQKAITAKVPLVEFDKMPRMTEEEQYQEMRAENRRKYNYVRQTQPGAFRTTNSRTRSAVPAVGAAT